jgi:hypothetical protein
MTKEIGPFSIRRRCKPVVWACQLVARYRPDSVRRDDYDELCFFLDEIAATEKGALEREILEAWETINVLTDLVTNKTGNRESNHRKVAQLSIELHATSEPGQRCCP